MSATASSGNDQPFSKLGQQEKQVLLLLSGEKSNQDIARALFLGEGTVRNYVHSLLSKMAVDSQGEAVAYALKHDLRGHMGLE